MLTKKPLVRITLAAVFALNALWGYAEIMSIGQGELPGDNADQSKWPGLLEDRVTSHGQEGGLSGVFQRIATFPVFLNTDEGT